MPTAFLVPSSSFCPPTHARLQISPLRHPCLAHSTRALPRMSQSGPPPNPGESPKPGEPPSGSTISKMLEVSFRNVWLRLISAGVGGEYDAAIQQFVIACVTAYKAGYSLTALKLELAANEISGKYLGREVKLTDQEKETRLIWIALVYMTLAKYRFVSERTPPSVQSDLKGTTLDPMLGGLGGLVESVCDAADRGYNLQTFKMELSMKAQADNPISPEQASIRSQWSRIIFATVAILPDSLKGKR
eukprot:GFKZ01000323.1.p1 GENE.GFKZ01000323.1~~GFKZ01000323.1.p1  ORF type:complete len:246 (+),score=33.09 GFKZ01000323.1:338-1075(+)